jgi:threonine synthase
MSQTHRSDVQSIDEDATLFDAVEQYEDLLESEVGDTPLVRSRRLERAHGVRMVYLKLDGDNPTGTHKDRIAWAQAMDALRRGYDAVTVATCGNYGVAMAVAASAARLRCEVLVPERFHSPRLARIAELGAEVHRVPGSYEDAVVASRARALAMGVYDANPGGDNVALQLRAYGEIAYEIYDELRDAPAVVACPASNGTTIAGIYRGFASLYRRGKTSRIPRMVAGSAKGSNPILAAILAGSDSCPDLPPDRIRETVINEPLVNWHSIDGELAVRAVRESGGWAGGASDRRMAAFARDLRDNHGFTAMPASTAGLVAFLDHHETQPLPPDRYVVVLTGRQA